MLNSLLASSPIVTWVIVGVMAIAIVGLLFFSSRRRKKQEKDAQDLINAVQPGNKVKTIGGICGIVVEVNNEEQTFVLETGTEQSGKCFIKFDRQAIYQTDAVVTKTDDKVADSTEEKVEPAQEVKEEVKEEVKTEEVAAAPEVTEEKTEKKSGKAKKE